MSRATFAIFDGAADSHDCDVVYELAPAEGGDPTQQAQDKMVGREGRALNEKRF